MITNSFFDDGEDETASSAYIGFWKKSTERQMIKESKFLTNPEKYFKSVLYKRTKKTNEFKPMTFITFGNRISYVKVAFSYLNIGALC